MSPHHQVDGRRLHSHWTGRPSPLDEGRLSDDWRSPQNQHQMTRALQTGEIDSAVGWSHHPSNPRKTRNLWVKEDGSLLRLAWMTGTPEEVQRRHRESHPGVPCTRIQTFQPACTLCRWVGRSLPAIVMLAVAEHLCRDQTQHPRLMVPFGNTGWKGRTLLFLCPHQKGQRSCIARLQLVVDQNGAPPQSLGVPWHHTHAHHWGHQHLCSH